MIFAFATIKGGANPVAGQTEQAGRTSPAASATPLCRTNKKLAKSRQSSDSLKKDTAAVKLLENAQADVYSGNLDSAERAAHEVLSLAGVDPKRRQSADSIIARTLEIRRQFAQLDEIGRLLDHRHYDAASAQLKEFVPKATNRRVLDSAQILWKRSHPGLWQSSIATMVNWFWALVPFFLALIAAIVLVQVYQFVRVRQTKRWLVTEIADSTDQGVGRIIPSSLYFWLLNTPTPITTGLLLGDASRIPIAPGFTIQQQQFVLAKELEALSVTIGPVDVGAVGKVLGMLSRLFKPRRQELYGLVYVNDKRLVARLTARYFERSPRWNGYDPVTRRVSLLFDKFIEHNFTVTAIVDGSSLDAARVVAEEVTFKMLYSIAKDFSPIGADQASELRRGLEELRAYVYASAAPGDRKPWESLENARRTFEKVRASPSSVEMDLDAHLYEGIALDLLEDHEGAIGDFEYVKKAAKAEQLATADEAERKANREMYERGAYNEAIANLRNLYQYKGIKNCIELIDVLTDGLDATNVTAVRNASPILALGLAVKADAIGCKPIVWKDVAKTEWSIDRGNADRATLEKVIEKSNKEVSDILTILRQVVESNKKDLNADWDLHGLRQLKWAIHNAEGDFNLYSVVYMDLELAKPRKEKGERYLDVREIRLLAEAAADLKLRSQRLEKAARAFHMCEQLLPAGVETLCNLGTLYLTLGSSGDLAQARTYLTLAIALNPNYEYAYYKLAQTWEMDQLRDKVIETLRLLPKRPSIPGFMKMYREYFVQPRLVNESVSTPEPADSPKHDTT